MFNRLFFTFYFLNIWKVLIKIILIMKIENNLFSQSFLNLLISSKNDVADILAGLQEKEFYEDFTRNITLSDDNLLSFCPKGKKTIMHGDTWASQNRQTGKIGKVLRKVLTENNVKFKDSDIESIVNYGVLSTPAIIINGKIKLTGRVPTVEEAEKILQEVNK